MSTGSWLLVAGLVTVAVYLGCVGALIALGRRTDAKALVRFVPDCLVLGKRLIGDPRVTPGAKVALGLLVVYLASPIDLVPDFIPVAGQLDDAIVTALVLRFVIRSAGEAALREHWPGPEESLHFLRRLV